MKNILIFSCMLVFAATRILAGGPDIELETSKTPYKPSKKIANTFDYVFAEDEDNYYALRSTYIVAYIYFFPVTTYYLRIATYDKSSLDMVATKDLFPKKYIVNGVFKPTNFWGIHKFNNKITAFFSNKSQKTDDISIYTQEMQTDGTLEGSENKLFNEAFKDGKAGSFNCVFSKDSTKILYFYTVPNKKKENQTYKYFVYNHNLEMIYDKEVELPELNKDVSIVDYDIDNDGNVYALAMINEKKDKTSNSKSEKVNNYTYKFFIARKESDEFIEYEFDIERYINSMTFSVQDGEIFCSGFWGKNNSYDISGVYTLKLDAENGEELVQDVYEFDDEFVNEFYTEGQVEKAEKRGAELDVPLIDLNHFEVLPDGSAILIGEQFYTRTVCYSDGKGGQTCRTYYYYNDIVATRIDPAGEILWSKKIPKKSVSGGGIGHLRYYYTHLKGTLYFFYNDHPDNFDQTDLKKYKSTPSYLPQLFSKKGCDFVCTSINIEGEAEKILVHNSATDFYTVAPISLSKLDNEHLIGEAYMKGGKEMLVRLTIR
jgi:hypothetical protein